MAELKTLNDFLEQKERPIPRNKVAEALNAFFSFKLKNQKSIVDVQLQYALVGFKHLVETAGETDAFGMTSSQLWGALKALSVADKGAPPQTIVTLADLVYGQLEQQQQCEVDKPDSEPPTEISSDHSPLYVYMVILARCGKGQKMKGILEQSLQSGRSSALPPPYWHLTLKAFIREAQQEELSSLLALMDSNSIELDKQGHEALLAEYAQCGSYDAFKKWYKALVNRFGQVGAEAQPTVVEMCIQHKDYELGQSMVNEILSGKPSKRAWDVVLKWAALKGQSVEDIDRMIGVMINSGAKQPNARTINGLVELAYSMSSPALAEGFMILAARRRITLDGKTYMMQMAHCLSTGDVPGAENAFMQAQQYELPRGEEVGLLNELIQGLCKSTAPNHTKIMECVESLMERKAQFAPETVALLTRFHLQRGELLDAIDIVQTHAHQFGLRERSSIQTQLVDFIKDGRHSVDSAWDAYTLLREVFPETDVETRTMLMEEFFFSRKRCDMGVHVFGHMRQASLQENRPSIETYVRCLEGIARVPDMESLELVHNMLKLDAMVEFDTRLRNALMLAFLASGSTARCFQYWDDIVYSPEGPTYNSICIAFRACEMSAFGDERAASIWERLERFEVETTPKIYAAYVGALAGQGMLNEAIEAIQNMERAISCTPDILTYVLCHISRFSNTC